MQYSPKLAKRLLEFCKLRPLWSALMVPIFKFGNLTETSSTSESLFKDLKSIVFQHKRLPLRLDDFLIIHVNSIVGLMNILGKKESTKENINNKLNNYEGNKDQDQEEDKSSDTEKNNNYGYNENGYGEENESTVEEKL